MDGKTNANKLKNPCDAIGSTGHDPAVVIGSVRDLVIESARVPQTDGTDPSETLADISACDPQVPDSVIDHGLRIKDAVTIEMKTGDNIFMHKLYPN
jgi:hypothetical protein